MRKKYTANERVVGVLPVGEKAIWEKHAKEDGFTALWTWCCFVIRQYIKEKEK